MSEKVRMREPDSMSRFCCLNLEVLGDHFHGGLVVLLEWDDDVSVLHCWLDEVVIGWFDKPIVLHKNISDSPTPLRNVSFNFTKSECCVTYFSWQA